MWAERSAIANRITDDALETGIQSAAYVDDYRMGMCIDEAFCGAVEVPAAHTTYFA